MQSKKIIVSNWKLYVSNLAEAQGLLDAVNDFLDSRAEKIETPLVFCPKDDLLEGVASLVTRSHLEHLSFLGAQDLPETSPSNLQYVILGHSSRRWDSSGVENETSAEINQKIKKALDKELLPIVCIGERDRDGDAKQFIKDQINKTFSGLTSDQIKNCIIAYEPVWAISANPGAEADNALSASGKIDFIKDYIKNDWGLDEEIAVLYGGSVSSSNVADFLSQENIDGLLIGQASTIKEEFIKILSVAN